MDSNRTGLRGNVGVGLARRGVVATFRKVSFSSRKAFLSTKKEANCYWSLNIHSSDSSHSSSVDSELE